ncbi:MAG: hypothetical protein QW728_06180 [Thermoplasmata archaeon]
MLNSAKIFLLASFLAILLIAVVYRAESWYEITLPDEGKKILFNLDGRLTVENDGNTSLTPYSELDSELDHSVFAIKVMMGVSVLFILIGSGYCLVSAREGDKGFTLIALAVLTVLTYIILLMFFRVVVTDEIASTTAYSKDRFAYGSGFGYSFLVLCCMAGMVIASLYNRPPEQEETPSKREYFSSNRYFKG